MVNDFEKNIVFRDKLTKCWYFFVISSNSRRWTSGFLASKNAELVNVVAVVSNPANKNNSD